jgi:hypothetical protein
MSNGFGGGWFNSESLTENIANTAGSGFQDANDFNSSNLSGLDIYKSPGTTIAVSQTDHGAIELGLTAAAGAVNALADITLNAFGLNNSVLDFATVQTDANRNFVGQFTNEVTDFATGVTAQANGILDAAQTETENTRAFAAGTINHVTNAVSAAANGSLLFADDQTRRSTDAILEATESALKFGTQALATNERVVDKSFSFAGGAVTKALDSLSDFAFDTLQVVSDQATKALVGVNAQAGANIQAVSDATRSDAANSLDKVVTMAGYGIGALAIATIFMGKK